MEDEFDWTRAITIGIASIALCTAIIIGGIQLSTWLNTNYIQPANRTAILNDANRGITEQHWFHQTYEDIQADNKSIPLEQAAIDQFKKDNPQPWGYAAQSQYGQLTTNLQGTKEHRLSLIHDYNARADNTDYNRYLDKGLPAHIDDTDFSI